MGKHSLTVIAGIVLALSWLPVGRAAAAAGPETAPAGQADELAGKLLPEIQAVAMVEASGAKGFASGLAAVVKKHGTAVPEELLKGTPAAALSQATEEQNKTWNSGPAAKLLADVIAAQSEKATPAEMMLTLDLLEAFGRSAPCMALRLQAAERLLLLAGGQVRPDKKDPPPALAGDPRRAVEVAKAVTNESLAATWDGRDSVTLASPMGMTFASVVAGMVKVDLLSQKEPTRESLEQCVKQWQTQFGEWKRKARDRVTGQLIGEPDKMVPRGQVSRWIGAALAAPEVKPLAEAFYKAVEKRDQSALLALLSTSGANMMKSRDMDEWTQQVVDARDPAGPVRAFRLVSIATPDSDVSGAGGALVCTVIWTDAQGQEHTSHPRLPYIKTDKGWRIGETP